MKKNFWENKTFQYFIVLLNVVREVDLKGCNCNCKTMSTKYIGYIYIHLLFYVENRVIKSYIKGFCTYQRIVLVVSIVLIP